MECIAAAALAVFVVRERRSRSNRLYHIPGLAPLLWIMVFYLFQILSLPAALVQVLSPGVYRIHADTTGLFSDSEWLSLSLDRGKTLAEFFRFSAYVAVYILTVQLMARGDRLKRTVFVVMSSASILAILGILQYLLYNGKIFWFRELTAGGTPFGPFVNRNHYAGYMEMVFPVALGVFLTSRPSFGPGNFRERVLDFLNHPRANAHILSGLACTIMGTSIFLSLSRGGIISLCISLIVFGLMLFGSRINRRRGVVMVTACVLILLSVGWFGWRPIIDRFERIRDARGDISDARIVIWADSLKMIRDFPVFGAGFGSYIDLYPRYRTLEVRETVDHAHNDYLELLEEGGVIGAALLVWFLGDVLMASVKSFRRRRDPFSLYLFMGCIAGLVAMLIHSVVDFNLHIGSNGLYFFFLAGLAVSASHTRFHGEKAGSLLRKGQGLSGMRTAAVILLLLTLTYSAGTLLAGYYYGTISVIPLHRLKDRRDVEEVRRVAFKAVIFNPLEPAYRAALGDTKLKLGDSDGAIGSYRHAVLLNPVNGEYLQRLGLLYAALNDRDRAERLLSAGVAFNGRDPAAHRQYGLWLLDNGERAKGVAEFRTATSLEPKKTRECIALLALRGFTDEQIRDALPQRVEPRLIFAHYLRMTGREELAREEFRNAFRFLQYEKNISPDLFYVAYGYFVEKGYIDDAISVMKKAAELLPQDAGLRLAAARAYEKAGMVKRAAEEYRRVLIIDPKNETARRRLSEIR